MADMEVEKTVEQQEQVALHAEKTKGDEGEAEYFVEDEDDEPEEVSVLMCLLNQGGSALKGKRIWRRIAVPSNFSMLELHVALQNAFEWEDGHLHEFVQPKSSSSIVFTTPKVAGVVGRTDISSFPILNSDEIDERDMRTFKIVDKSARDFSFTKDDIASDTRLLTPIFVPGKIPQGGDQSGGKDLVSASAVVFVEHSHPHIENSEASKNADELAAGPIQVMDERAFCVGSVLTSASPLLIYNYNFQVNFEVHVFFEGKFEASEGVNYPLCLSGEGSSLGEDGDELDDKGALDAQKYAYGNFAVLDVNANYEKTYESTWPAGPGSVDSTQLARCYACKYFRECGRRKQCTGTCCDYCLKSRFAVFAGSLSLAEADEKYEGVSNLVLEQRRKWVEAKKATGGEDEKQKEGEGGDASEGGCAWVEKDGSPCVMCA